MLLRPFWGHHADDEATTMARVPVDRMHGRNARMLKHHRDIVEKRA